MSAIFASASPSHLVTANNLVGSTPAYPVLMLCKLKLVDVNNNYYFFTINDNAAVGALDGMFGTVIGTGDLVRILSFAAGSVSNNTNASQGTTVAGAWMTAGFFIRAANSRNAIADSTLSATPNTSNIVSTGLTQATIGAAIYNASATVDSPINARIAELFVASGFGGSLSDAHANEILDAYHDNAIHPPNITYDSGAGLLSTYINAYQPLRGGLDDPGFVGPSWTNTNVTFDATDHPFSYGHPSPRRLGGNPFTSRVLGVQGLQVY